MDTGGRSARDMTKNKITSGDSLKTCSMYNFNTSRDFEWKDHIAECYEDCKKCDYSTASKANYLRHLKRNHTEQADESQNQSIVQHNRSDITETNLFMEQETSDEEEWFLQEPDIVIEEEPEATEDSDPADILSSYTETNSAKEQCGSESSDEDEWLLQEPDIAIGEEPEVTEDGILSYNGECHQDKDDRLFVEATSRKRKQPLPMYTSGRPKTPGLESVVTDVTVKTVDVEVQTDPMLYTKSIKTTTIVREEGRKIKTVKREKML